MNSKVNIKIVVLIFCISLAIPIIISNVFNNKSSNDKKATEIPYKPISIVPKVSEFWTNFTFIHIDGNNWSVAAGYEWCNGDGSWGNPYIIENISMNAASSVTGNGIFITNSKNVYFIIRNCKIYNAKSGSLNAGIKLQNTSNGTLINNNCSNNNQFGIFLYNNCNNNMINNNIANSNLDKGIVIFDKCKDNSIIKNAINNNVNEGLYLELKCNNTVLSNNIVSNIGSSNQDTGILLTNYCSNNIIVQNKIYNIMNEGIFLNGQCNNNHISDNNISSNQNYGIILSSSNHNILENNTANDNGLSGIYLLDDCNNNTLENNIVNNNGLNGIFLFDNCNNNTLFNNIARNIGTTNQDYGIQIQNECNYNNITENYLYSNIENAIYIQTADCNNTLIKGNVLVNNNENWIKDIGTDTIISLNYYLPIIPYLNIHVVDQIFSTKEFIVSINISSSLDQTLDTWIQSIRVWWNGNKVSETNIIKIGNGLYNIILTPILVKPGQPPILLNMTITSANHKDKYYETNIAVDPENVEKNTNSPSDDDDDGTAKKSEELNIPGTDTIIIGVISVLTISMIVIIMLKKRIILKRDISQSNY